MLPIHLQEKMNQKFYFYYANSTLDNHAAHLGQQVNCANATANLGYPAILGYHANLPSKSLPKLLHPLTLEDPPTALKNRYNVQDKLRFAKLPVPAPFGQLNSKFTALSTLICKYYLPFFIRPKASIVHSRDWNFIKAAVKLKIPAIYEQHHFSKRTFEPEIVNSPYLQLVTTVTQSVLDQMVQEGMPSEKIRIIHNGFNQDFMDRHSDEAHAWRQQLLSSSSQKLIVYAGGLNKFKGVDLLIEVAKKLPQHHFAIAGGDDAYVRKYQAIVHQLQTDNVTLLGCLPHSQLAPLLQAADVLAHPHLATIEATFTSPLKFFEYLAAGTPIVASKITTLQEFFSAPAITVWCAPDSAEEFAQAIEKTLIQYPRKTDGYSETLKFVRQFSWENRMKTLFSEMNIFP